ncbi:MULTISPECIES: hypothetical protein [Rathayibacter]|uniref:Uncharacterized protein n=1 Tax=Rathayibacter iranicus NCPPB 2253 = VKM Ac-1602 TaxID=1328868 RepID=A0ABX5LAN1_9MICO|nr:MULTISPECIES: hypothetical protein [Rathayibacter]MWV32421.1 hypothetical protein [Rathayibacter iranicus NCPPB 2253 = VKM Ac-1602]NRD09178.1 hypothetical protein [Rathayibacter agropyri]PWJ61326.1 hypothetical protein B0H03_11845 [Rathayibacter iranicus NCPPB 2253 = VKM Ac-1602]
MTGLGVVLSFVLFLGGILVLGNSFLLPDIAGFLFFGGIVMISGSLAVAFHVLPKSQ